MTAKGKNQQSKETALRIKEIFVNYSSNEGLIARIYKKFIAKLFIIARIWHKLRSLSTNEWIKKA